MSLLAKQNFPFYLEVSETGTGLAWFPGLDKPHHWFPNTMVYTQIINDEIR